MMRFMVPEFKSYVRQPQLVRLGRTDSGQHGLFTGGFLAWPLSESDYLVLSSDRRVLKDYADKRGFDLYPLETEE